MKETFGEYIHNLRIENNLTLTKLAAALDIDQSTLSKIENQKRNVTEEILPKLANIFDLDLTQLEILNLAKEKANYYKIKKLHKAY